MAVSVENIYRGDRSWRWKSVLRVINLVMALLAISCVAWLTYYLRQWQRENPEYVHRRYQSDIFILPWLLFTLCLSALWNTANILIPFFHSRPLAPSASIACNGLLIFSLLASGTWFILAATTNIDGTSALRFRLNTSSWDYSDPAKKMNAVELVAICTTLITALLHIPPAISASLLSRHNRSSRHHHITRKDIEHLSIHPALRPSPSPLPYPNPNHPTCAYGANMCYPPPRAVRYKHQASPLGVHAKEDSIPPLYVKLERKRAYSVPQAKGGVLSQETRDKREEKAVDF
ncbi:MAG: hypothetical protein LQ337_003907 [Flavoplaca oasis]|nr:MAG: hypothetical protein LQ337_003907 [Flavoplaca oasis]